MTTRRIGQLVVGQHSVGIPGNAPARLVTGEEALAEHVRFDDLGRYRPLSGARTMPTGWKAPLDGGLSVTRALEVVYPLAETHRRQYADGTLRVVPLEEVLIRQSGRYEGTASLSPAGRKRAVRLVCGECVRAPVWHGAGCGPDDIPCPEPCSVLVAFCREAAEWERTMPARTPADPAVPWAAFEEPGNELRERYLEELNGRDE